MRPTAHESKTFGTSLVGRQKDVRQAASDVPSKPSAVYSFRIRSCTRRAARPQAAVKAAEWKDSHRKARFFLRALRMFVDPEAAVASKGGRCGWAVERSHADALTSRLSESHRGWTPPLQKARGVRALRPRPIGLQWRRPTSRTR